MHIGWRGTSQKVPEFGLALLFYGGGDCPFLQPIRTGPKREERSKCRNSELTNLPYHFGVKLNALLLKRGGAGSPYWLVS